MLSCGCSLVVPCSHCSQALGQGSDSGNLKEGSLIHPLSEPQSKVRSREDSSTWTRVHPCRWNGQPGLEKSTEGKIRVQDSRGLAPDLDPFQSPGIHLPFARNKEPKIPTQTQATPWS